jgi:hypothetical protein
MHTLVLRLFFPSTWAVSRHNPSNIHLTTSPTSPNGTTTYRGRSSTSSDGADSPLFSAESGEAMVGFDVPGTNSGPLDPREANRRRRENMERFAERNMAFARGMASGNGNDDDGIRVGRDARGPVVHPEGRLNRELEAGFMDDSEEEGESEDDEEGVTVGRRSMSRGR